MASPAPLPVKDATWNFTAGLNAVPQLQEGKAQLIIEAVSNGLFRKKSRLVTDVTVVTRPPTVSVDSEQHYLYLGMAELATFNVSGSFTEAGIRVGDQTFRAWPMPGGKPGFFSLFAFAWNMPAGTVPVVYAANGAGNVTSPLVVQFPKKEQPKYTSSRTSGQRPVPEKGCGRTRSERLRRSRRAIRQDQQRDAEGQQQDAFRSAPEDRG